MSLYIDDSSFVLTQHEVLDEEPWVKMVRISEVSDMEGREEEVGELIETVGG
jgi:hypothetical protein